MKHTLLMIFTGLFLTACTQDEPLRKGEGLLRNYTGFDGCGWVILVESSIDKMDKLEPINLNDFNIVKSDSLPVTFHYEVVNDRSICQVGWIVRLGEIKKR